VGIERIFAVVARQHGRDLQALQWAVDTPERVENVPLSSEHAAFSAQQIAFNETGRQAIYADPYWNNGDYYGGPAPCAGWRWARMVCAHYLYERPVDGNEVRAPPARRRFAAVHFRPAGVRGRKLPGLSGRAVRAPLRRQQLLYITKAIDHFDLGADYGSLRAALQRTQAGFLVVSFSSDWLYPSDRRLSWLARLRGWSVRLSTTFIDAPFGHDSFSGRGGSHGPRRGDISRSPQPGARLTYRGKKKEPVARGVQIRLEDV